MSTKRGCPSHAQPMQLKLPGAPFKCSGCKELGLGLSYRCENPSCNYILHEECANAVSLSFHPFFAKSEFEFYEKSPGNRSRYCDGCGNDVLGFVYHCSSTKYDLHPCCLKLKGSISDEEGLVTLELCHNVPSKCVKCKHKSVAKGVKGTWSYPSSGGSYCYHVSCVKELILENWNYLSQDTNNSIGVSERVNTDHTTQLALRSMEMVQTRRRSRRINRYTRIAVLVFKLVVSAVFGNPISAIAALVEALVSD